MSRSPAFTRLARTSLFVTSIGIWGGPFRPSHPLVRDLQIILYCSTRWFDDTTDLVMTPIIFGVFLAVHNLLSLNWHRSVCLNIYTTKTKDRLTEIICNKGTCKKRLGSVRKNRVGQVTGNAGCCFFGLKLNSTSLLYRPSFGMQDT